MTQPIENYRCLRWPTSFLLVATRIALHGSAFGSLAFAAFRSFLTIDRDCGILLQPGYLSQGSPLREAEQANTKTRGFPFSSRDGLAFSGSGFKLPTGKNRLSGAKHVQFEAFSHGEPPE